MHKRPIKRKKELSIPLKNVIGVTVSSVISVIISIIISLIFSLIISKSSELPDSLLLYFIGCIALGSLAGGILSSKLCSFKGIISGLICSMPTSLLITFIMLFFSSGKLDEKTIFMYVIVIVSSVMGGIIGANTKRRK